MTILSELNLNELGTSGIITAVIASLTLLGFLKGSVKLVFLLFTIAGSVYAAYWGSEEALTYLQRSWPAAPGALGSVFAVICGLVSFYFLSKIFSFFTNPFENSNLISRIAFGVPAALVSLLAATGLVWLSLNLLKDKGAEGEIKYWISQDNENAATRLKNYPTLANLKQRFESSIMGKKMANIYKLHDREKYNLAKLLVISSTSGEKITKLAENERVKKVLRNPEVRKLMNDTTVRKLIAENNVQGLLMNPDLNIALTEKKLMDDLISISAEPLR